MIVHKFRLLLVAAFLLNTAPAVAGLFSDTDARAQIKQLEARLATAEEFINKLDAANKQQTSAMLDLQTLLDSQSAELRKLRGLNEEFYHKVVKGSQIEDYLSEKTGINLKPVFDQYLRDTRIPVFEFYVKGSELTFRWTNCVNGFDMPLKIWVSGKAMLIYPRTMFNTIKLNGENEEIKIDPEFYVATFNTIGK